MCAYYEPPIQNLAIFDPIAFGQNDEPLTIATGSKYFLRFPYAQNTENLQAINVNGVLTANSTSEFKRPLNMSSTVSSVNRTVASSYYNFYDSNVAGSLNQNGTLYNSNGSMYLQNTTNSGNINFVLNDAGGVQNTPLQLLNAGINLNKPTTISTNNNLNMPAGTGIISQPYTTNDNATSNTLKKTTIITNNSSAGGNTSLEVYDAGSGRGFGFFPNGGNATQNPIVQLNDSVISGRFPTNNCAMALTLPTNGPGIGLGMRIATTSGTAGSVSLRAGTNIVTLDSSSSLLINNTTTFNGSTGASRQIQNLGTLNFLDISANVSTSSIYMNTSEVLKGMFYDCSLNSASHNFRVNDASGNKITPMSIMPLDVDVNVPINFGTNASALRQIQNLGTLIFTELTSGITTSTIYTDATPGPDTLYGMYYDCSVNGGNHMFKINGSGGAKTIPFTISSTLTSTSNTLTVRNATTTSNRLDIDTNNSQKSTLRARSATASTNAQIEINCDTVNGAGTVATNNVMNIEPFTIKIKRPIEMIYTTTPSISSQLGYTNSQTVGDLARSTQASPYTLASDTLPSAGTWQVTAHFNFQTTGNNTYTTFSYAIGSVNNAFPATLPYTITYMREPNTVINNTEITRQISMTIQVTTGTTIYFTEQVVFGGGGTTNIGLRYSYTRIG